MTLRFGWDERKALSNALKHGVSFEFTSRVFDDPAYVDADASREADGENRRKAIGMIDGKLYTLRFSTVWIISARRANPKEDRQYGHIRP